jgi:uncharacterized membrane protein YeaQ/YmgE (transglycosylase-associated protein family)
VEINLGSAKQEIVLVYIVGVTGSFILSIVVLQLDMKNHSHIFSATILGFVLLLFFLNSAERLEDDLYLANV